LTLPKSTAVPNDKETRNSNMISVILIVHEAIYNNVANNSLLSEFQFRDFGVIIDSICHKHGATQKMMIQDDGDPFVLPLYLAGCMIHLCTDYLLQKISVN
jgi:hypothetical protein